MNCDMDNILNIQYLFNDDIPLVVNFEANIFILKVYY